MGEHVSWLWEVEVQDGKLDDFKALMGEMVEATKAEDGTLIYEWYVDDQGSAVQLFERFRDPEAAMVHVKGFGAFAGRFMELIRPGRLVLLGAHSEDTKAALAQMRPEVFGPLGGFSR